MIRRILRKQKVRNANFIVEPDEIFLDSKNLQNFDSQQFEGRIEKPIPKKTIFLLETFFVLFVVIFSARLGYLQIQKGGAYFERSENNTLEKQLFLLIVELFMIEIKSKLLGIKKMERREGFQFVVIYLQAFHIY